MGFPRIPGGGAGGALCHSTSTAAPSGVFSFISQPTLHPNQEGEALGLPETTFAPVREVREIPSIKRKRKIEIGSRASQELTTGVR